MQVLRRCAHRHRTGFDETFGDEARIEVDVLAHRVVAHVLDPAGKHDVGSAVCDLACACRNGGERPGAHPVDREARHSLRQPGEQRDVAAERQALIADLGCRRVDDVADALGRNLRVSAQQLAHDLDRHIVGSRLPEHALRPGPAECRPYAVDEHDLPTLHR